MLTHTELQGSNDPRIEWRMLRYFWMFEDYHRVEPLHFLIYVGRGPMRMNNSIRRKKLSYEFRVIDLSEFDGAPALASAALSARYPARSGNGSNMPLSPISTRWPFEPGPLRGSTNF